MARKITLVAVAGLAVLAITALPAFAIGTPDAADRAEAAKQANMLDAREKALSVKYERARPEPVRDDRFRLDPTTIVVPAAVRDASRQLEWPPIGIGFAAGALLAIALGLSLRAFRRPPLAH